MISFGLAQRESSLLSLIYSYLRFKDYVFLEDKIERTDFLRKFWISLMQFLKSFQKNPHPFLRIWLLNIFYMCAKKYPLQEIINEYSIFRTLHDMENGYIEDLIRYVCEASGYQYERGSPEGGYCFFFPLPAKLVRMVHKEPALYVDKIFMDFPEQKYLEYFYKVLTLQAIQTISINLLLQTYESKKTFHISKRLNTFTILCIDQLSQTQQKTQMSDKINEELIKLVHQFLQNQQEQLFKLCRSYIQNYFDSAFFFQVSIDAINYQKDIIKWYTEFTR